MMMPEAGIAVKALNTKCTKMPSIRRNRRLRHVVEASTANPAAVAAIACSPDPYPSDGPGVNYLVTRDLVDDVDAYEHGVIDHQTLIACREIKWRETQDFDRRQHGYAKCQHKYRHEWKVLYSTPERKLTAFGARRHALRVRTANCMFLPQAAH
ncbi:hypothetical protein B0H14DRAFT_3591830 [Mycena olivaceomarginata]|nr:hypothetical protein B0H14DRAFT_3591830 [Mycena olivaceomarginata]